MSASDKRQAHSHPDESQTGLSIPMCDFKEPSDGSDIIAAEGRSSAPSCCDDKSDDKCSDPRAKFTMERVDWDALITVAKSYFNVPHASWMDIRDGGYNLVRFLLLDDELQTQVVIRVPLCEDVVAPEDHLRYQANLYSAEVAVMELVRERTNILVPRVYKHGAIGSEPGRWTPFIIMEKLEGTHLSDVWDEMEDRQRDAILEQVASIIFDLSSIRFEGIGVPAKEADRWTIVPESTFTEPRESNRSSHPLSTVFVSTLDYWTAHSTMTMEDSVHSSFGSRHNALKYGRRWLLRSFVPGLYADANDQNGFPLQHGDFHSQNILVHMSEDGLARITGIIDWSFTKTVPFLSFATFPLFMVDHPLISDNQMSERNQRDRKVFIEKLQAAEKKNSQGTRQVSLSKAFASSHMIYLFEQCQLENDESAIFTQCHVDLIRAVCGVEEAHDRMVSALLSGGLLDKKRQQFESEYAVWKEVHEACKERVDEDLGMTRDEFLQFVTERQEQFSTVVYEWIQTNSDAHRLSDRHNSTEMQPRTF